MSRPLPLFALLPALALVVAGCDSRNQEALAAAPAEPAAVAVQTHEVTATPVTRHVRVSGTLAAQEAAEVAAEVAGRVVATPVERGSQVGAQAPLIRIADAEATAQATEADANAAQIEARLGLTAGGAFDVERVPDVANAKASYELARTEFERTRMLQERQLVSQQEFDQRQAQAEAARRQYEVARNGAEQQYQSLMAARARVALARKTVADTVVRAPFQGVVGERFVSVGDYVTRGTKVASVLRVSPLRLELTVPAQYVRAVAEGRPVALDVDAYPGETFTGTVRFVSPALQTDTRALVVEALVENADGRLKPGLFATARIEQAEKAQALLIPAAAVRKTASSATVYVVKDGRAEARLITLGQTEGDRVEAATGLTAGDTLIVGGLDRVTDGALVTKGR
ncbi:MAG: efflux RND transporter periplasmic adaptor subunit [Vicinamibacterales bacterium]